MQGLEAQLLSLADKHRARGIILDTNVLLLLLFNTFAPDCIGGRRLERYGKDDGALLTQYVSQFCRVLTTPHILTETSNLARQVVRGPKGLDLSRRLHPLFCLSQTDSFEHCVVEGRDIDVDIFGRLGLTDSGLASLVKKNQLLLTDDLDLYLEAVSCGGEAINFSHMRELAGLV